MAAVTVARGSSAGRGEAPELGVLAALAVLRSGLEARLIEAAVLIVGAIGRELLADKRFGSVDELTPAQRAKWRTEAKRLACAEIEVKLGLGVWETRALVGVASAPASLREAVVAALDQGWVTWRQVHAFWQRCAALPADAALLVAEALFGTDPGVAARDRLDPEGVLREGPWQHAPYRDALEREARAAEGSDVAAERERRRAAYAARRTELSVHDDGTATMSITGPLVTMCALSTRVDRAARSLRKHGDPRTLDELRTDVAGALLLHGTLPLLDQDPEDLSVADLEQIARILNAQPAVHLQVIVPWDALSGAPVLSGAPILSGTPVLSGTPALGGEGRGGVAQVLGATPAFISPGQARELALTPGTTLSRLLTDPADGRLLERSITTYRPDAAMRRQILAADVFSRAPGSRQPMTSCELDHVIPWGPPHHGPTSQTNLAGIGKRHHDFKTKTWWSNAINTRRDLTWTTLLAQTYTTRQHDYRQYLTHHEAPDHGGAHTDAAQRSDPAGRPDPARPPDPAGPNPPRPSDAARPSDLATAGLARLFARALDRQAPIDPDRRGQHPCAREDLQGRRDLVNQALYAAITDRGPHALLADHDDQLGAGEHGGNLAGWIWVTHTHQRTGRRHAGPPQDPQSAHEVLGLTRQGPTPLTEDQRTSRTTPWTQRPHHDPPPF